MGDDTFYISLKNSLKRKLTINLIKDEDFKNLNIEDLIKRVVEDKLNGDIDFNLEKLEKSENKVDTVRKKINRERLNKTIELNQDNPKRIDSKAYNRYEKYKSATNYTEFLELGGNNQDYNYDLEYGNLKEID